MKKPGLCRRAWLFLFPYASADRSAYGKVPSCILIIAVLIAILFIYFALLPHPIQQEVQPTQPNYSDYACPYDSAQLAWEQVKAVDYLHCEECGRNYLIQMVIKGELYCVETVPALRQAQ